VTWELSLTGLLIGLLVGMTGMGGGSLMTPILVLVFDFNVVLAVGTDILHGAIFKTIGAARHRALGHVHARLAFWLALGSVPASLAGVYVIEILKDIYGEDLNDVATRILGVALVFGGAGFLLKTFVHRREPDDRPYRLTDRDRAIAFTGGVLGGFVLGLTSVGSGTFFAATGWLALGSIPGILIGSQWTVRLPERAIRVALGLVLLAAGLRLATS
jgi:uncharacterized membrane protein YfcA